jgi:hypothetical protein
VLRVGGKQGAERPTAEEELNEPVTQRWTSTGSIPALRAAHAHFAPFWTDILACVPLPADAVPTG